MSIEGAFEYQKLNQMASLFSFGWVIGGQLNSLEKSISANAEIFVYFVYEQLLRGYSNTT